MHHPGQIQNIAELESPALVFYADKIRKNTELVLEIAKRPDRLWPHIKTHKTVELVDELIRRGVTSFKCATIAEAELLARAGAKDVLIAYPLVGPNVARFAELSASFSTTRCSLLVESRESIAEVASALNSKKARGGVFIDLDMGMGRTGVAPDDAAMAIFNAIMDYPELEFLGLHAYDGHNRQQNLEERQAACTECVEIVRTLKGRIEENGIAVPYMIFGGTPTFTCYAEFPDAELSPGTAFLYDWGYSSSFPDLPFEPAAFVLGRVISDNSGKTFTLDVGSKAIAADPSGQRGLILEAQDAVHVSQSEEHWVFAAKGEGNPKPGDTVLIAPAHVCPTVHLYENALVVEDNGVIKARWQIVGRTRKITI